MNKAELRRIYNRAHPMAKRSIWRKILDFVRGMK